MNTRFPADIFTEPEDVDIDTLRKVAEPTPNRLMRGTH